MNTVLKSEYGGVSMDTLYQYLSVIIQFSSILLEFIGVIILLEGAMRALVNYIKKDPDARMKFYHVMAMALEFKLGGEILRTVIVRDFSEIALVGCIIVLRAALSFLIQWSIKTERTEEKAKKEHETIW